MSQPILSKGYCQCRSDPNRIKRGGRQTGEREFHYGTTVALVLKNAKSGILCRWNSSDTTSSVQAGDLLCYDETVCIVSNEDSGSSLHDLLFPPPNHSKLEAWSLDFSADVSSCRYNERHSHATIREQIPSDRNSFENHDDPKLLALEVTPINVRSLSIEVELNTSEDSSTTAEALLHAHWKRQLTGKIFLQADGLNTSIRLNKDISFRVKSLTPKASTTPSMTTFIVLPSTRITIHTKTQIPRIIQRNPPNASMVTKLLVDIIHCVANRIPTSRTILLSGPPGVGKTYSVKAALAHCHLNTKLVSLRGSELLQQQLNPARALEREFQMARSTAGDAVVLLFLDECDALVSVDSMAAMLATLLDQVDSNNDRLVVVGATNRIESIPNMLRRPGRFDREIPLSPPNVSQRFQILSKVFQETLGLPSDFEKQEIRRIAELCVGYVPADLAALFRRAAYLARQDQSRDASNAEQASTVNYLKSAMNDVSASALRDAVLAAPPNTTWDDIAGDPGNAKTSLRQAIEWPRLKRDAFEKLGLTPPRGILLHGPPGCSKTTLARAAAGASGVAFLSLNPAQVYASSYMGEAESVIRKAFTLARAAAPCILFFDEVDSIFGEGDKARGSSAEARVLSTFLNEMDGVDRKVSDTGVLVLGATNRPWTLDAALLRPGRMGDKIVYVPPPDRKAREQILQMQFPDQVDFDFETLAGSLSEGMTGAEIIGACQSAKQRLLRDLLVSTTDVQKEIEDQASMKQDYLEEALKAVKPLLSNPQALKEFRIFENKCQR